MAQNGATPMAEIKNQKEKMRSKSLSLGVAVFFGMFRSGRQVSLDLKEACQLMVASRLE